jgi:flagellar hook-associated protein 1 FlgK
MEGIAEKIRVADGKMSGGLMDAAVMEDGSLQLRVDPKYSFAFGPDTSNFLTAAGFNNFFSGIDSATIDVDKFIREEPKYIAAADHTGGVGNNRVAQAIIDLKQEKTSSGVSIDEFYGYITGKIAIDRQQIDVLVNTKDVSYKELLNKHQNMKGVSLEEEEINMVIFQRALEANSRFVNTVDEMLNLIVNNLGLVGR